MEIIYPTIKGVKWEYPEHPELVTLKYITIDSNDEEMGLEPKLYLREGLFDLSQISAIRDYFDEKDLSFAVDNECVIDLSFAVDNECVIDFMATHINVFKVKKENAIQAWLFYKSIIKDKT